MRRAHFLRIPTTATSLRLSTLAPRTGGLFSTGTSSDAAQPPFGLLEASEAPSRLSEFDLVQSPSSPPPKLTKLFPHYT